MFEELDDKLELDLFNKTQPDDFVEDSTENKYANKKKMSEVWKRDNFRASYSDFWRDFPSFGKIGFWRIKIKNFINGSPGFTSLLHKTNDWFPFNFLILQKCDPILYNESPYEFCDLVPQAQEEDDDEDEDVESVRFL